MRYCLILLLIVSGPVLFAQKRDAKEVKNAIARLDSALICKDTVTLKRILADDVRYCHSTGWVQDKKHIIGDLVDDTVTYTQFTPSAEKVTFLSDDIAMVRYFEIAAGIKGGKHLSFDLNVFTLWAYRDRRWELKERMAIPRVQKKTGN